MSVLLNDILRVATRIKDYQGEDVVNVWHVRSDSVTPVDEAAAMVELGEYMELIYGCFDNHIDDNAHFYDINVFNVTQNSPMGSTAWPTFTNGSGTGDVLPAQTACLIRGTTGKSRNWARKFLGPFTESMNTDEGRINGTLVTELIAAGVAWLAGYTGSFGDWVPVVWHHKDSVWRTLVSVVVRDIWSTIRRRRIGRGA
jgi:hypothetical protein